MPNASEGSTHKPKHSGRSKEYYCFHRERWQQEKFENITRAIRWMERYLMFRLEKSQGAPISLNQSAMAVAANRTFQKKDGSIVRYRGPGLRTIQRSWRAFMAYMGKRGCKFGRAHSKGVGLNGKRPPRSTKHSKLGWIAYRQAWEDAGNQVLRFIESSTEQSGSTLRSRWVRDECLQLVAEKPLFEAVHSAKLPGIALSSGEQTERFKQTTSYIAKPNAETEISASKEFRQKYKPWRLPHRVLSFIWAISRSRLGADAEPIAHRVIDLWYAGYNGWRLLPMFERAVGWAAEARTGHRGKIAAAALAGILMKTPDPFQTPPSNEEFWTWMHANVESWRTNSARRIKDRIAAAAIKPDQHVGPTLEEMQQTLETAKRLMWDPSDISQIEGWIAEMTEQSNNAIV